MTATTYVVVDVETTGLDAQNDSIIEVAAITLRGNDILDEFSSLVNPHRSIPAFITQLTGITQVMVDDAPTMFTLRSRLRPKIGDHVLVGHNVGFDLGFLEAERLGVGNHRLDTVTLASILFQMRGGSIWSRWCIIWDCLIPTMAKPIVPWTMRSRQWSYFWRCANGQCSFS